MKLFCAYAFTGEDLSAVENRMRMVVDTLEAGGQHSAYCNRFDPAFKRLTGSGEYKSIFRVALANLKQSEIAIIIVTSPNRSVGQIIEFGAALSQGKPIYLFEHSSASESSYLSKLSDLHFTWTTDQDLRAALQEIV